VDPIEAILDQVRDAGNRWLQNRKPSWKENPFEIKDLKHRELFIGYEKELKQFLQCVDKKESTLVSGNIGNGKTTILNYVLDGLPKDQFKSNFLPKAPNSMKNFFSEIIESITRKEPKSDTVESLYKMAINEIRELTNSGMKVVIVIDELGDASKDALEWIRTLHDVGEVSIIASGPPETRKLLETKHFPLADRIPNTIFLDGFDKMDCIKFINKRIRYVCTESDLNGGEQGLCSYKKSINCNNCLSPFTADAIDELFSISGGTPRSLLKLCNDAINTAMRDNLDKIDLENIIDLIKFESKSIYETLTDLQKKIVNLLKKGPASSTRISDSLHSPTGSILNQLNELMEKGPVLRSGTARNYEYKLSPEMERYLEKGV
jgi:type II secretory pathway predicted ATPase ExeA